MEITLVEAIAAAVSIGVSSGIAEVTKQSIQDAYNSLKEMIAKKKGPNNPLSQTIELYENRKSEDWLNTVRGEVQRADIDKDHEIQAALSQLLQALQAAQGNNTANQYIASGQGSIAGNFYNSTITTNVNNNKDREKGKSQKEGR